MPPKKRKVDKGKKVNIHHKNTADKENMFTPVQAQVAVPSQLTIVKNNDEVSMETEPQKISPLGSPELTWHKKVEQETNALKDITNVQTITEDIQMASETEQPIPGPSKTVSETEVINELAKEQKEIIDKCSFSDDDFIPEQKSRQTIDEHKQGKIIDTEPPPISSERKWNTRIF
ncbi:hypothetical protein F8M41_007782 [Gigaspora margarita]|uniref:Uncharacterized protein n=1 Tax=Gigaspora margarita TaxID=4874 RepID=A0A8H4B4K2_GIGMA|nr:hypothetical protein F8M41_007782 [Gigaspora margarita]